MCIGCVHMCVKGVCLSAQLDSSHYPNWTEMVSQLASKGIKTLTYINPLLSDVTQRQTPYQHNYYREALDNGYAVRRENGSVWSGYSDSILVDLSNPNAYQWMVNMIVKVQHPFLCSMTLCLFACMFCVSLHILYPLKICF